MDMDMKLAVSSQGKHLQNGMWQSHSLRVFLRSVEISSTTSLERRWKFSPMACGFIEIYHYVVLNRSLRTPQLSTRKNLSADIMRSRGNFASKVVMVSQYRRK